MSSTFARARTEEQRETRRAAILAAAAEMLQTTRINDLSLNELARRVGLAKSNVLRYFESREAVLLALLASEYTAWLDALEPRLSDGVDAVATAIAETAAERPVLCELVANAPGVLEHNVSADVAADYKRAAIASAERLVGLVAPHVGGLSPSAALVLAAAVNLVVGGVWTTTQPSPGMRAAYAQYPDLAAHRFDLTMAIRELIATVLTGLEVREPRA